MTVARRYREEEAASGCDRDEEMEEEHSASEMFVQLDPMLENDMRIHIMRLSRIFKTHQNTLRCCKIIF